MTPVATLVSLGCAVIALLTQAALITDAILWYLIQLKSVSIS